MDGFTEMARLLKERNNKEHLGVQTGEIIKLSPLEIRLNEFIVLNSQHITQSQTFNNLTKKVGQKVILIPTSNQQHYYAIDGAV